MPFSPGTRLGPYEIVASIGADGTAVYKATDAEHQRTVAIKMLPRRLATNAEARQQFERSTQTLSGLSHPHICALHEVRQEEVPGEGPDVEATTVPFVVMDYLEGETLSGRMKKGPLPLGEAVRIATALADALHAAHRLGIVHGNLRPTNVMLVPDAEDKRGASQVKLLDFGMAAWEQPKAPATTASTDKRAKATLPDVPDDIVRYLAPEQIEGREADVRADIFAFGTMLYEMVTGEKAFEGRNRPMLIAAISTLDPYPLSKNQPDSPALLDHVAQRCLAKDPDDRWQTTHDLLVQLRWLAGGGDSLAASSHGRRKRERRLVALVAIASLIFAATATQIVMSRGDAGDTQPFQFRVPVAGLNSGDIAISPDGKLLAVVAKPNTQEVAALFVRSTGVPKFDKLVGTDGAAQPFWSPDSKSIGFTAGGRVKRVEATGGAPKDLGEATGFTGGAWGTSGVILFGSDKGLYRVSAEGEKLDRATMVDKGETGHYWPSFLPDGQHYVYVVWSADAGARAIYAGALGSKDRTKLMAAASNPVYADPGYILFHRDATLFAQPFDAKKLSLNGEPLHIADLVEFNSSNGHGSFDVSQHGALVYSQSGGRGAGPSGRGGTLNAQWGWRDRAGRLIGAAGETGTYGDIDLSPDGKQIAITRAESIGAAADIYVIDWQRAVSTSLTLDPADDLNPVWSRPDGDRIAFTTWRKGNADIYIRNANAVGPETPLLDTTENESIEDWSKDGRYIAYKKGPDGAEDLWILPLFGDKKPFPIVQGPYHKDEPQFSYDGKWLAYSSDESGGVFQVFITSFPGGEQKLQVSKDGGGQPRWKSDGKELYFRSLANEVMAVDVTLGAKPSAAVPHMLFGGFLGSQTSQDPRRHQWNVIPDGQRFLMRIVPNVTTGRGGIGTAPLVPVNAAIAGAAAPAASQQQGQVSSGLTVIRNWPALAKAGK
jgi:Tol biopolymer transport system component